MIRTNIEEYIKALKGEVHTNRISVVLYDEEYDIYHYISKIRRNANECEMLSVNYKMIEYFDLTLPFIDQLNHYYGHCSILRDDPHIGQDVHTLCETLNQQIDECLRN
jgi:hypothetical protein